MHTHPMGALFHRSRLRVIHADLRDAERPYAQKWSRAAAIINGVDPSTRLRRVLIEAPATTDAFLRNVLVQRRMMLRTAAGRCPPTRMSQEAQSNAGSCRDFACGIGVRVTVG